MCELQLQSVGSSSLGLAPGRCLRARLIPRKKINLRPSSLRSAVAVGFLVLISQSYKGRHCRGRRVITRRSTDALSKPNLFGSENGRAGE
jgi:hypothetical protein